MTMKVSIEQYTTGWSYGISVADCHFVHEWGVVIDAHASSLVEVQARNAGTLQLIPGVTYGGSRKAAVSVRYRGTTALLSYHETYSYPLEVGESLLLRCDTADTAQAWNHWVLLDTVIVPTLPPRFHFNIHNHLGDGIAVAIAFENYCAIHGIPTVEIDGGEVFFQLCEAFQFTHVVPLRGTQDGFNGDHIFGSAGWREPWVTRFYDALCRVFGGSPCETPVYPPLRAVPPYAKEEVVLGQFDSRSTPPLDARDVVKLIDWLRCGRPFAVLGGPDTKPYLGERYQYRMGPLPYLISQLLACRYVIGSDSGIAHLAGILGVRSFVVNCIDVLAIQAMFSQYPNTTVLDRRTVQIL